MLASTATQQKAAYLLLTSAALKLASHGDVEAAQTLENCRYTLVDDMTLPTLLESQDLVAMLIWPKYLGGE